MVLAVLQRRAGVPLADKDVYASTVGGARVIEPAADLAVALAVAGSADDRATLGHLVAFGEVGLAGEIRPVLGLSRRLAEARRLGFTTAVVPPGEAEAPDGMALLVATDLSQALELARSPRLAAR
jgi:DNA repair protein RadA/Sms